MTEHTRATELLQTINRIIGAVKGAELQIACTKILHAERIFLAGAGQTGLVLKMFGMRLMQLGLQVHIVGEATTPAIAPTDLLLVASGSGETTSILGIAQQAQRAGAKIISFTSAETVSLATIAGNNIIIPALPRNYTDANRLEGQFLNSLFEQCLLFVTGLLIEDLLRIRSGNEAQMLQRHANLE